MTDDLPERFGRWTVVSKSGPKSRSGVKWVFRCECGTEKAVIRNDVINGRSQSCGCLSKEMTSARSKVVNRKHGMERSTEYRIWIDMRRRCHQPQRPDYKNYGARGVTVCDQWRFGYGDLTGFEVFYKDMGPRPSLKHTLDRVKNSEPYSAANCRWGTSRQQDRNKRTNRFIEVAGERMTVAEASERFSVPAPTIHTRLRRGLSGDEAIAMLRASTTGRCPQPEGS